MSATYHQQPPVADASGRCDRLHGRSAVAVYMAVAVAVALSPAMVMAVAVAVAVASVAVAVVQLLLKKAIISIPGLHYAVQAGRSAVSQLMLRAPSQCRPYRQRHTGLANHPHHKLQLKWATLQLLNRCWMREQNLVPPVWGTGQPCTLQPTKVTRKLYRCCLMHARRP